MKNQIKKLCVSAILISLGTVLSLIKVVQMPLGGTVTFVSMLPILLISVFYGTKYALLPCLLFGTVQMAVGGIFGWGLTPKILIGSIIFDYLIAFGVLSLGGIARKSNKGIVLGCTAAMCLRFVSHIISGVVFFSELGQFSFFGKAFENMPLLYSVAYNGLYMLPEIVITAAIIFVLCKTNAIKNIVNTLK